MRRCKTVNEQENSERSRQRCIQQKELVKGKIRHYNTDIIPEIENLSPSKSEKTEDLKENSI